MHRELSFKLRVVLAVSLKLLKGLLFSHSGSNIWTRICLSTGSENIYSQYVAQQYAHVYGIPGALNTAIYSYGQLSQPITSQSYTALQGYTVPSHHYLHLGGPSINGQQFQLSHNSFFLPIYHSIMMEMDQILEEPR
ncbi:hypothetical protein HPP92_020532 [Vanilla planifolia]|uniref:Uncharacterized protein n=1 Tax=Vanilla planifolia TaxID=51239 RepID=A0A835Q8N2_VANPL|nr:hypothetical protein HPP92_020532 [Vanilla planifolia]